jgi:hypothetical protein
LPTCEQRVIYLVIRMNDLELESTFLEQLRILLGGARLRADAAIFKSLELEPASAAYWMTLTGTFIASAKTNQP